MEAMLTSTSTRPNVSTACSMMARQSAGFETSPLTSVARRPAASTSATVCSASSFDPRYDSTRFIPRGGQFLRHDAPDPFAPGNDGDLSAQIHGCCPFAAFDDGSVTRHRPQTSYHSAA